MHLTRPSSPSPRRYRHHQALWPGSQTTAFHPNAILRLDKPYSNQSTCRLSQEVTPLRLRGQLERRPATLQSSTHAIGATIHQNPVHRRLILPLECPDQFVCVPQLSSVAALPTLWTASFLVSRFADAVVIAQPNQHLLGIRIYHIHLPDLRPLLCIFELVDEQPIHLERPQLPALLAIAFRMP